MQERSGAMSKTRVGIDSDNPNSFPKGTMDHAIVGDVTEEQIASR